MINDLEFIFYFQGSVGILVPGVDAKLSNGQDGEILVRRPHMLAK
jgi:long-subunit acyl-CoA synthetase (AMP-forming)